MKSHPLIKKTAFYLASVIIVYVVLELCSLSALFFMCTDNYTFPDAEILDKESHLLTEKHDIHPYLGFVHAPRDSSQRISEFGFADDKSPILPASDERTIIGIFGGSVARLLFPDGLTALESELRRHPAFREQEIVFLNCALPGYKQPQQLMTLNYILSLGGHLDIVINIDGFNELALPVSENIPQGVSPFYPRGWELKITPYLNEEEMALIGQLATTIDRRQKCAAFFSQTWLRYSACAKLTWKLIDRMLWQKTASYRLALFEYRGRTHKGTETRGPTYRYGTDREMYSDLASMWKRSSLLMNDICQGRGIAYFHFLQPSQYVPDSKPLHPNELRWAYSTESPYYTPVSEGYTYLVSAGGELRKENVRFYDLRNIFQDITEPLYIDTCCHFNRAGCEIMGKTIGTIIRDAQ